MTIAEAQGKCKSLLGRIPRDVLILAIIMLASSASFGLGYFAGQDAGGTGDTVAEESAVPASPVGTGAEGVVASKNGTKYYLPSCAGAARISEGNKVRFASAAAAVEAGYAPAANCKGL